MDASARADLDLWVTHGAAVASSPAARGHLARAREFRRLVIDPAAAALDRRLLADPAHHPEEIVRAACDVGLLSLPIPRFAGGAGGTVTDAAVVLEELCAGCAGIGNVIGAHYLGLCALLLGFDLHLYDRFLREVVRGEKRRDPVLFAAAITEPEAGTDVEDRDLLRTARLGMSARKVSGGYRLDGTKVFISNGSVARYVVVVCALDRARPVETFTAFVVPSATPGFSVGRIERKMGQRACHASELVFADCCVPEELRLGPEGAAAEAIAMVLAASRPPVGAIATGIARGAHERALAFCRARADGAGRLVDRVWVQQALASMIAEIRIARAAYLHAAAFFDRWIFDRAFGSRRIVEPALRATEPLRRTRWGRRLTAAAPLQAATADLARRNTGEATDVALGLSSLAKFSCADAAVRVCLQALEVVGPAGAEERHGIEKCLRDAKLTQIYEGTNQLNRRAAYETLVRPG